MGLLGVLGNTHTKESHWGVWRIRPEPTCAVRRPQVLADASGPGGAAAGPVPRIAEAGDAALEASVKQHGCTFRLNFAEVLIYTDR